MLLREHSLGRLTVLLLALLVGLQLIQGSRPLLMASLLAAGAVAGIAAAIGPLAGRYSRMRIADSFRWAQGIVLFGSVSAQIQGLAISDAGPEVFAGVLMIGTSLTLVFLLRSGTALGSVAFWLLMAGYAAMMLRLFAGSESSGIDVQYYLEDASRDILAGQSPYGGSIENPYSATDSERYLHPDLVQGGRILIGFPYLPAVLLMDLFGFVLGDVRYAHLVCLLGAAALLRQLACDQTGRVIALLPIASPLSVKLLMFYWVEPVVILVLVVVAVAVNGRRRTLGVFGVAMLLLTKQYFAAVLPFVLVVGRRLGLWPVLQAVGLAFLVVLFFYVWNPAGFWNDVVMFQFQQPFRRDSISLTTALWQGTSTPPAWVTGSLPLAVGLAVSSAISVRAQPGACALMLTVGLGLFVTVLMSKQAFPNYYALVHVALATAVVTWPRRVPDSPGTSPVGTR